MPLSTSPRARSGVIIGVKPSRTSRSIAYCCSASSKQHGFVLQKVEAMAGDAGAAFEIDQVVLLGKLHVVEHGKAERPHVDLAAAQLLARVLAADRRLGMREIRHRVVDRARLGGQAAPCAPGSRSFSSRSRRPSSLRASRSASSFAWPIDLLTTFACRESSSTSACSFRRCDSSSTNRATSTFTPRRSQFS